MFNLRPIGILILFALAGGACSDKLETGYSPRKLGASDAARRGYYAEPFSADAHAAAQERREEESKNSY